MGNEGIGPDGFRRQTTAETLTLPGKRPRPLKPFDHFLVIDWSSRSKPSPKKPTKDAIWVADATASGRVKTKYFRTRRACVDWLAERLRGLHARKKRVLVGWDFAFGYPAGLAAALKCPKKKGWKFIWKLLAKLVKDKTNNKNNRFAVGGDLNRRITGGPGPFWGAPAGQSGIFLGAKRDFTYPVVTKRATLAERRLVERRLRSTQPAWKLAYAGSVGGQSLVGIPHLYRLTRPGAAWREASLVWPFTTRFDRRLPAEGPVIVHAEIYPSMVERPGKDKIVDREQVKYYLGWLQQQQRSGKLAGHLAGPENLKKGQRKKAIHHEGWILGVG